MKRRTGFGKTVKESLFVLISMMGYVPRNTSPIRILLMSFSFVFLIFLNVFHTIPEFSLIYFLLFEVIYFGFIFSVLTENGLRGLLIKRYGENEGYLKYETILGFIFFHNGTSIGLVSSSFPNQISSVIPQYFMILAIAMFIVGFAIKYSAAKAVTIDIYYWKDMFLGRKISEFVVSGPYKYLKNPMYGFGQLQSYAVALYYSSEYGLFAALLNQILLFTFYFSVEKLFIKKVYYSNNSTVESTTSID